jgi:2-polyprenyl-6-methoxyphenol hydroxylase-like FAD-dependent oxidoreductase
MLYDVITVGGGIAGAALAKNLAEHGYRVLVLEREKTFRDRVRGEQMHPWGVTEARALGIYDRLAVSGGYQTHWWLTYQGQDLVERRDLAATTPHGVGSFNCYHPQMQEAVLQLAVEAGAEVRRSITVEAVEPGSPAAVRVCAGEQRSVLQARLVVGADGRASRVRRWSGFTVKQDPDRLVLAGALLEGASIPDEATYAVRGPDSFVLMAPLGNQRARTYFICRKSDVRSPLSGDAQFPDFLAACRASGAPGWFDNVTVVGPLAQFNGADHWVEHPATEGVVLVGDAAAASDPSYGCGLSLALMGVRHLRDCLLTNSDWRLASELYARQSARYYGAVHRITNWLTELRWRTGAAAEERRAAALARFAAEPDRIPDIRGLGPEAPSDEETRRFLLGEQPEEHVTA